MPEDPSPLYQTARNPPLSIVTLFPDVPVGRPRDFGFSNVISVGIDLTHVSDVRKSLETFGEKYLRRLFTAREIADCKLETDPVPRLAARFSAKEATIKALKVEGFQPEWTSMEVWRHPVGGCDEMHLSGTAALMAARRGIWRIHVSLSHEEDAALAVVVATRAPAYGLYVEERRTDAG